MSTRRNPGEIVRRNPGSGFVGSPQPELVRVPDGDDYMNADPCVSGCGDPQCREWPNMEIVEGPHAGAYMYHISECEMFDSA